MATSTRIVSELMHQPLTSVGPGATVDDVMLVVKSKGIHHVPIVQGGKLLGLVCTCDLEGARGELRVLHRARRHVVTVKPDCSAVDAAKMMKDHAVGSLIVSNRDGLWGIVTRHDLMHADDALAALLADLRCEACHSTHHLREGDGGTYLCVRCAEGAAASHWFDQGGAG